MRIFISGGCKNGKSSYAQILAKHMQTKNGLYYVATMIASDKEDDLRIELHKKDRIDLGFETLEIHENIFESLKKYDKEASYLVDSTTALLSNQMFKNGNVFKDAYLEVAKDFANSLNIYKNIVIVSDYIYSDSLIYNNLTNLYRKGLAYIDKEIAKKSDIVIEMVYGNIVVYKGDKLLKEIINELY